MGTYLSLLSLVFLLWLVGSLRSCLRRSIERESASLSRCLG